MPSDETPDREPWGHILDCPVWVVEAPDDAVALRVQCPPCGNARTFTAPDPKAPFPVDDVADWIVSHDCVPDDAQLPINLAAARRSRLRVVTFRRSLDEI